LGLGTVVTSAALIDELDQTLRDKFTLGPAASEFLEQWRLRVALVEPAPLTAPVSRDPDDDLVLATAVTASAGVIVTGDRDLLVIGQYADTLIVTPRDFLARLAPGA
jgi:putative PIN family toxin of toxin-antitoxin system